MASSGDEDKIGIDNLSVRVECAVCNVRLGPQEYGFCHLIDLLFFSFGFLIDFWFRVVDLMSKLVKLEPKSYA